MGVKSRIKYYILATLILILVTVLIVKNFNVMWNDPLLAWSIFTTLISIHALLSKFLKKYKLWLAHFWYSIANKSLLCNFSIDFWGSFPKDFVNEFQKHLMDNLGRNAKLQGNLAFAEGITLQFELTNDFENPKTGIIEDRFHIEIFQTKIGYNELVSVIREKIISLISFAEKKANNPTEQFNMTISFQGLNPYYGFFLQHVDMNNVNNFNVDFYVNQKPSKNYVKVTKEKISVSTESHTELLSLAERIILLSS